MKFAHGSCSLFYLAVALVSSLSGCGGEVTTQSSSGGVGAGGGGNGNGSSGGNGGGSASGSGAGGGTVQDQCDALSCGAECITEAGYGACMDGACVLGGGVQCMGYEPCLGMACGQPCSTCDPSAPGCTPLAGAACSEDGKCATPTETCEAQCKGAFCDVLDDGPWLIGWGGGADHFSWVRFTFVSSSQGTVSLLDPVCATCVTYFGCEGPGFFWIGPPDNGIDPDTNTIVLELPNDCIVSKTKLVIVKIAPAQGFPANAVLTSSVAEGMKAQWLEGYQYPPAHCDAAFTTCADPFQ